jgi:anaerobic magnesium-protoporphyrin IX monomethyl ester cyclase
VVKVMLVYPLPQLRRKPGPHWAPLGLAFIAAALQKEGHEVTIFDRYAEAGQWGPAQDRINGLMMERVRNFRPDIIGLNTITPLIYDSIECAELIREEFAGLLIAGGHHVTALPDLSLQRIPQLDLVVQGEGELVLPKVAGGEKPGNIPGVWWREGEVIKGSSPEQIEDLDNLPYPAVDLLDIPFYTRSNRSAIRAHDLSVMSLITSRGCTMNCDLCTESLTYGRGVRMHGPEYVLNWAKQIVDDYPHVEALYFLDNDFLIDRERAVAICKGLIESGLNRRVKFAAQTRVNRLEPELLKLLKNAGCVMLEMGIESSSQKQLDSVHKGTTVEMNRKALEMCRKAGIAVHSYMIMGFEGETVEDLEQRLRWMRKTAGQATLTMGLLKIYPGTRLYREKGEAFFENNPWARGAIEEYYRTDHLSGMTAAERINWIMGSYRRELRHRNRKALLLRNSSGKLLQIIFRKAVSSLKSGA